MPYRFVHDHLVHRRWSPEQIVHRLRVMEPDDAAARVSHETIHAAIYAQPRGGLKAAMVEALRQAKSARGLKRITLAGSAMVPESLRIIHRPEEIEVRLIPGHWEGDLIKGAFNRSSVGTLVERKTRCAPKFDSKTAKQLILFRLSSQNCDNSGEVRQVLAGSGHRRDQVAPGWFCSGRGSCACRREWCVSGCAPAARASDAGLVSATLPG